MAELSTTRGRSDRSRSPGPAGDRGQAARRARLRAYPGSLFAPRRRRGRQVARFRRLREKDHAPFERLQRFADRLVDRQAIGGGHASSQRFCFMGQVYHMEKHSTRGGLAWRSVSRRGFQWIVWLTHNISSLFTVLWSNSMILAGSYCCFRCLCFVAPDAVAKVAVISLRACNAHGVRTRWARPECCKDSAAIFDAAACNASCNGRSLSCSVGITMCDTYMFRFLQHIRHCNFCSARIALSAHQHQQPEA